MVRAIVMIARVTKATRRVRTDTRGVGVGIQKNLQIAAGKSPEAEKRFQKGKQSGVGKRRNFKGRVATVANADVHFNSDEYVKSRTDS